MKESAGGRPPVAKLRRINSDNLGCDWDDDHANNVAIRYLLSLLHILAIMKHAGSIINH